MSPATHPASTPWDQGRQPGHEVVALGAALVLTVVVLDLLIAGRVSMFFDLWFVIVCLALAVAVRPRDFFTVGVLPPLIMVGTFTLLAFGRKDAIAEADDGVVQAVVSGLAHHSGALIAGYAVCLLTLLARQRLSRR